MRRILLAALLLIAAAALIASAGAARAQIYSADDFWRYPAAAGFSAAPNDNGAVVSSYNAGGTLTLTLPPNAGSLPSGWHIGIVTDNGNGATVQTNATAGGQILYPTPGGGGSVTSLALAAGNYEFVELEADSSGNFRLVAATPATAQALGLSNAVTGPGSSTNGYVARWSGTSGRVLSTGTPVGNSGANTILQTDSGGQIDRSVIPSPLAGHLDYTGSAPAAAANCGTGATVGGNDVAGRVNIGTSPGTFCQLTFASSWVNAPVCDVWNETSGAAARVVFPQPSSTVLAIVNASGANLTAGDNLAFKCAGYR